MSFLNLHRDKEHEFKNGKWSWDETSPIAELKFTPDCFKTESQEEAPQTLEASLHFSDNMNVAEEKLFREIFQRKPNFYDSHVITLQDIKNLSFFLLKIEVTNRLIEFLHNETYDMFLYSIIFYFEHYLKVLEFLLIRRDQESTGRSRDSYSLKVEQFLSKQLSDRRLLIAREYSKILLMTNKEFTSNKFATRPTARKDLKFFEHLIEFTSHCTWIAMHRRGFNAISEYSMTFDILKG